MPADRHLVVLVCVGIYLLACIAIGNALAAPHALHLGLLHGRA